jgi:transcriptional regulator NrdR family protein
MTTVVKRGGKKQSFMPSKIKSSVKGAAKQAGLSRTKIEETVKKVGDGAVDFFKKKRVVKSTDIRKSIIGRLGRVSKAAASAWRRFERKKRGQF